MNKAVRLHAVGGPEVLRYEDVATPTPGPGEILIRQAAVGLNFIDVYFRTGVYKLPAFPAVIGMEAAGVVEALGQGVETLTVGDRIAYGSILGAYSKLRTVPADRVVILPPSIDFEQAAAMMLQGMTAQYLLRRTHCVSASDTILVHAAAGGVGLILTQWAKHLGARVIGVVSTDKKAELAMAHGCEHVLVGTKDLVADVKRLTGGSMVSVVYDGTGQETFYASLDCLAPRGLMVSYGNATGEVKGVDLSVLAAKGSLFVTRPTLATHIASREDLVQTANELFDVVASGAVKIRVDQRFPLADAAEAHRALEARRTTGSTVLLP
jgi:NADPH2:quinone reductase